MKKVLGINIDGVLRSYLDTFDKQYRKVYVHNESLVAMNDDFTLKEETEEDIDALHDKIKKLVNEKITLPVDSFDLLNHYQFKEELDLDGETMLPPIKVLEKFMFERYPFQIFGTAEEFEGASEAANKIQGIGHRNDLFEVVLLSTLKSQAIPATYHFLSKVHSRIKKVMFLNEDYQKWDYCDVVIDVMPETFQNKPEGKVSIKINHLYNQWDTADYSFNSLKEVNDEEFLKKIFA